MNQTMPAPVAPSVSYSQEVLYEIRVLGNPKGNTLDITEHTYVVRNKPLSIDDAKIIASFDFDHISYIEVVESSTTKCRVTYPLDYSN